MSLSKATGWEDMGQKTKLKIELVVMVSLGHSYKDTNIIKSQSTLPVNT